MTDERGNNCSAAPASVTPRGLEVVGFHLHRYLAPCLRAHGIDCLWVVVGFEGSQASAQTYQVGVQKTVPVQTHWELTDVARTWRHGDGRLRIEHPDADALVVDTVPLFEAVEGQQTDAADPRDLLGFVLIPARAHIPQDLVEAVQRHAGEAIMSARRNCARLCFDEDADSDLKAFLYSLMEHLPQWCGVDASASLLLSDSLDSIHLDSARDATFYTMVERLYTLPEAGDAEGNEPRLIGLRVEAESDSILGAAVSAQRRGSVEIHRFERSEDGFLDADGEEYHRNFHVLDRDEQCVCFVPLLSREEDEDELLGFLTLAFRYSATLSEATRDVLKLVSERLGRHLRHSPLYTLSARKLWVVGQVRELCEEAVSREGTSDERRSDLIAGVTELVERHANVPAFAVGYVDGHSDLRTLSYELSFGWTDFDAIDLVIDVEPDQRRDSGVSALAARLGEPFVLAGRTVESDHDRFNNQLFVEEETCRVVDARTPKGHAWVNSDGDWVRLGDYYKPARANAYASLAVPIVFAGEVLGIVAVEVDRDTSWYWWTGYGGLRFWELLAANLAFAFHSLR